jgi:hypothetical protein
MAVSEYKNQLEDLRKRLDVITGDNVDWGEIYDDAWFMCSSMCLSEEDFVKIYGLREEFKSIKGGINHVKNTEDEPQEAST